MTDKPSNSSTKEKNDRLSGRFICGFLVVNAICVFLFFNASCQRVERGEPDARMSVEISKLQKDQETINVQIETLKSQNKNLESQKKDLEEKINAIEKQLKSAESEITTLKNYPGARMVKEINGVEFAFRWCPAGLSTIGSPETEEGRIDNEKQCQITIPNGYWMLETEVTQKQWKAIMDSNPSINVGDDLPVDNVSWNDCMEFCKKCKELDFPVLLPTEAQWEYGCRAGTTGAYAGNLDELAWYGSNSGDKSHPVKTKKPNRWGLYDMHGNVWEWCLDRYSKSPCANAADPEDSSKGVIHVARGGSYDGTRFRMRSAARTDNGQSSNPNPILDLKYKCIGFRVVFEQ